MKSIFSSTCMPLLISAPTRKIGQLDTSKISEVMFLLHGWKNHTMEFLLSVSSTNNAPPGKSLCKILNWNHLSCVSFDVRIGLQSIFPSVQLSKKLIPFAHTFWHLTINYSFRIEFIPGAGIAQWLERRTRDWKVAGSNPCWNGGRIFFSRVNFLCWLLFRYPFHPRVTTVARKKSRSFCQKCRWQVTAKHAYTLRMWLLLNRASALVTTCP